MALGRGWRVVWWLAVRNLVRRGRVSSTVVISVALGLLTFLTVLGLGVLFGYQAVERAKLLEDPLSCCLWVGHPAIRERWLDEERMEALKQLLGRMEGVRGWYPCREIHVDWFMVDRPEAKESVTIRGRTIHPDDPFCQVLGPELIQKPGRVVVTAEFFRLVGHPEDQEPPPQLSYRSDVGQHGTCQVAGVLRRDLPWQHHFIVSEGWYQREFSRQADVRTSCVRTGHLPADWPERWTDFPAEVRSLFGSYHFFPPSRTLDVDGKPYWVIMTDSQPGLFISEFRVRLEMVCQKMRLLGFQTQGEEAFLDGIAPYGAASSPRQATSRPYNLVAVYVNSLSDLKPVKQTLEAHGFAVRDTAYVIERLDQIAQRTTVLGRIILGVLLAMGGGLLTLLAGVHMMRAETRIQEIGTLKALGMSKGFAVAVLAVEAIIVWVVGTALGLIAGVPAGKFFVGPALLAASENLRQHAFILPPGVLIGLFMLTLFTSLLAILASAWRAITSPPVLTAQP
ncbi:MAG: ABC transporter permease [Thermoguttaceae bacterium]|nr:ABC transporter permease [Thermoguttaceae bacterium]